MTASLAVLAAAPAAQAAYTPGLQQYAGTAGCASAVAISGCTQAGGATRAEGIAESGDDLYLSTGDDQYSSPGLFHYRRGSTGIELRSCIVQAPNAATTALGCEVVTFLPHVATRPAVADDAVYVGGTSGDGLGPTTGVVAAIQRDPATGELTADDATCRAAHAAEAPACTSAALDRLGDQVADLVVSPDFTTVHALGRTASETQIVTFERDTGGALLATSCLANVDALCDRPAAAERPLLNWTSELVIAPDGADVYLASSKGLIHLTRSDADGTLAVDDCVGDGDDLTGLCDKGPGDFLSVSNLSMTDDDQVIAMASGEDSSSVVRLLRDGSGTLTEAGCIGTVEGDGCGLADGVTNPVRAMATPDGKNVVVVDAVGTQLVSLIAGGAAGLRPFNLGTTGCVAAASAPPSDVCATTIRGTTAHEGPPWHAPQLLVADDDVIVTNSDSVLFFERGRAPGCLARTATAVRPSGALPLYCADPNGDAIAYAIGRAPANGTLGEITQNPSSVVYTPDDDYEGTDSFTYGAGDGTFTSAAVTYSLTLPTGPNTVKPTTPIPTTPTGNNGNGNGSDDSGKDDKTKPTPEPEPEGLTVSPPTKGTPKSPTTAGVIDLKAVGKQLTVSSKRIVAFKLSCRGATGAAACKGALRLGAASRLLVDGKRQVVTFGRKDYVIPAGATFTVSLRLTPKLAALITKRKPVAAKVLAIGAAPSSATPVQATVNLRR